MILDSDNNRRSSYQNGLIFREEVDDDLALFNELQSREHDDFLLKSEDDFEDAFSTKLRYFSDYKLGVSVPCRVESTDLLNADKDKDDYDWLLTPPDTPLFRSLDGETTSVNLIQRGRRPRSESISISRSSTMEKSYRSSRGSASPHRSTPSPQSRSSIIQSRGRPLSAPHSTPIVRQASPSRRASPPSSRPSTPAARSSSPTLRRLSTGSSSTASSSRARDMSSVKQSRGNSASPKSSAWPSNIPGFSLDVPPNLRTSLADRPASYVRGSSPASRSSRDKYGRQSISPTGSRSISSSHSQDRQQFCSSKGSVASSGDDDFDSLHSVSMGGASFSKPRKLGTNVHSSSRTLVPKKPAGRIVSSSSAPKRSFDYAMRQMDRKTPQNMFRPLLSSVPSSTFCTGKASSSHSTLLSGNSSITTSSNASSHHGAGMTIDMEGSDHNQDDMASEYGKTLHPDIYDEVFVLDTVDMSNDDSGHKLSDQSHNHNDGNKNENPIFKPDQGKSDIFSHHGATEVLQAELYHPRTIGNGLTLLCSKCSKEYIAAEQVESDAIFCPDCSRESETLAITTPVSIERVTEIPQIISRENYKDHEQSSNLNTMIGVSENLDGVNAIEPKVMKHGENIHQGTACHEEKIHSELSPTFVFVEEDKWNQVNQQVMSGPTIDLTHNRLESDTGQLTHHFNAAASKADVVDGVGISVLLLNRSSSSKGLVIQGRNFTASKVPYGNVPYTGDSTNSMRSSSWNRSLSSSSFDLSSLRGTDSCVQYQPSRKKSDMDNNWDGVNSKAESTESSCPTTSQYANQVIATANSRPKVNSESSLGKREDVEVDERPGVYQSHLPNSEHSELDDMNTYSTENTPMCKIMGVSSKDSSSICVQEDIDSIGSFPSSVDGVSHKSDGDLTVKDIETSFLATLKSSLSEEHTISSKSADEVDVAAVSTLNSVETMSEREILSVGQDSCSVSDLVSQHSKTGVNDSSVIKLASSCSDLSIFNTEDIMLENGQNSSEARSWTLEEATDTVLFCSSIVHNLAYHAATMAIKKEEEDSTPYEPLRPTYAMQEKPKSSRKNQSLKSVSKENVKSHKARQKQDETETGKPYLSKIGSDIEHREPLMQNIGLPNKADHTKPPKLESKCNCTIM